MTTLLLDSFHAQLIVCGEILAGMEVASCWGRGRRHPKAHCPTEMILHEDAMGFVVNNFNYSLIVGNKFTKHVVDLSINQ